MHTFSDDVLYLAVARGQPGVTVLQTAIEGTQPSPRRRPCIDQYQVKSVAVYDVQQTERHRAIDFVFISAPLTTLDRAIA